MSTELTVLNNNVAIQQGGLGINLNSKFFDIKPATLSIVQPNSQVEGGIKGNLRVVETGDQFVEMTVALLDEPREQRQYHIGQPGELNRTPENLLCFSTDLLVPHAKAKVPQAPYCATCSKADWTPWREYKEKNNGKSNKLLIPPCDSHYVIYLIDTVYNLPMRMYIRSKGKELFEQGMANVARIIMMEKAKGNSPNIFDVKFKIKTKQITTGQFISYVPTFTEPKLIDAKERESFGAVYTQYINQSNRVRQQAEEKEALKEADNTIESSVVEGEYVGDDKEISI